MPGSVFSANFAIAISAPVLPAETTPSARPSATASIASRMLERRARCAAPCDGLASLGHHLVGVVQRRGLGQRAAVCASSGAIWLSAPNIRNARSGWRSSAMSAPCNTMSGARSPPIASRAMVTRAAHRSRARAGSDRLRRSPAPPAPLRGRRNGRRRRRDDAAASARRNSSTRHSTGGVSAWCERRMLRRDGEIFFFGTAMGHSSNAERGSADT